MRSSETTTSRFTRNILKKFDNENEIIGVVL